MIPYNEIRITKKFQIEMTIIIIAREARITFITFM